MDNFLAHSSAKVILSAARVPVFEDADGDGGSAVAERRPVRLRRNGDFDGGRPSLFGIVLSESLAKSSCGDSDRGPLGRTIVGRFTVSVNCDSHFFDHFLAPEEFLGHYKAQEILGMFLGSPERLTCVDTVQLPDGLIHKRIRQLPRLQVSSLLLRKVFHPALSTEAEARN